MMAVANRSMIFPLVFIFGLGLPGACSTQDQSAAGAENLAPDAGASVDLSAIPGSDATPANMETDTGVPSVDNDRRTQQNAHRIGKIIEGTEVPAGVFLDVVGIAPRGSDKLLCTGTLIDKDLVLTAAHCACAGIDGRIFIGNKVSTGGSFYDVQRTVVGSSMQKAADAPVCREPQDLRGQRDLALMLLARHVAGVASRALAPDALVDGAASYRAAGFGATDRDATVKPREKREAEVISTSNDCEPSDAATYGCKPGEEIVAGAFRGRTDTCVGDSGGPLFVSPQGTGKGRPEEYRLAGVTSRATSLKEHQCGDGGIYERLNGSGRQWIADATVKVRAGG